VVVLSVVVVHVAVVRTQNSLCPAARVCCTRGSVARDSGMNELRPAARGSGTSGSGVRGSGTNAKYSKSSRAR
jgi:hypothetical protein